MLINRFNPADHYENLSGSTITFLTVSDFVWKYLGGRGVAFHNRLRASEYAKLFNSCGWSVSFWANAIDEKALSSLDNGELRLTKKYLEMDPKDVCTYYCWFVCNQQENVKNTNPINVKWVTDIL